MRPLTIIGYHGTTLATARKLLAPQAAFKPSKNRWEWLGHGVYFWQDAPKRARSWAQEWLSRRRNYTGKVGVIGTEIELTDFVDLLDLEGVRLMRNLANRFSERDPGLRNIPPRNELDCANFNFATEVVNSEGLSVAGYRACCVEGLPLVEGSPIHDRSHVQLAVLNQKRILRKWLVEDDG